MDLYSVARDLGALVGPVIPLRGKVPMWTDWPNRATRAPNGEPEWQHATGVGLVTGESAGFFALDVDGTKGAEAIATLEREHGALPPTWTNLTGGGGRHYFFRWPGFEVGTSAGKLGKGLDVRGNGGQVVGPGSRHKSGAVYAWAPERSPAGVELAELPAAWLDLLREPERKPVAAPASPPGPHSDVRRRASAYLARMDPAIEGSNGSGALWNAAQAMVRGFQLPEPEAYELLAGEYNPRCEPPWSEKELLHKIRDAVEKSSVPWGYILDQDRPLPGSAAPARSREEPGCDDGDPAPVAAGTQTNPAAEFIPFSGSGAQAFPVEVFPPWLASYVRAVAGHIQVPVDGPALSVVATLAAVVAKRIHVRRVADGYEQPLNLYLLGLGEPGERKSQIVSEVTRPLREYEIRIAEDMQERVVKAVAQRKFEEERARHLRHGLATGKIKGNQTELRAELDALEFELSKPLLRPPRLVTSAPTQGALEQLLADNGERMAILGAEGGVFGIVAGRFSGNAKAPPDMDILLGGWSGDPSDSDRKTTQGARLKAPAITIGLFVQPQVFREISDIYGADEKGLTSRFLVAMVESNAHRQKYMGEPMDEVRRADWRTRITELLESFPADADEKIITLPTGVLRPAEAFFDEVTAEMAPGGPLTLPALRAFGSKLRGQVERLIGVLHVARHGPQSPDAPVSEETVLAAVAVARYFLAHGKAVRSAMAIDETVARAQRIVDYLVFNRIANFKRREAQMNHWGGCRKPQDLDAALAELRQRGYLTAARGEHHLRPELLQ